MSTPVTWPPRKFAKPTGVPAPGYCQVYQTILGEHLLRADKGAPHQIRLYKRTTSDRLKLLHVAGCTMIYGASTRALLMDKTIVP